MVPYRFHYTTKAGPAHPTFLNEMALLLRQLHLEEVFGVRLILDHDHHRRVEVPEGQTYLFVPEETIPNYQLVETMWIVIADTSRRVYYCTGFCRIDSAVEPMKEEVQQPSRKSVSSWSCFCTCG